MQRDIYGQNKATLSPFVNRGNVAGDTFNALLGLGGGQQPSALAQFSGTSYSPAQGAGAPYGIGDNVVRMAPDLAYRSGQNPLGAYANGLAPLQTYSTGLPSQPAQSAASNAFDIFRNSTGYQFRVNEGMDALNSGYAGSGLLQSGAALKALDDYRQNMASAEFGNYLGYLGQQQGTGLQAAGAQAGVGLNYANNVTALNQQNANALSNAAVARANNSNALIGSLGSIGSGALGYFGGR